jgi:hypothetical protein
MDASAGIEDGVNDVGPSHCAPLSDPVGPLAADVRWTDDEHALGPDLVSEADSSRRLPEPRLISNQRILAPQGIG